MSVEWVHVGMYVGRGIYVLTGGKLMYYIGAYKVDACGCVFEIRMCSTMAL